MTFFGGSRRSRRAEHLADLGALAVNLGAVPTLPIGRRRDSTPERRSRRLTRWKQFEQVLRRRWLLRELARARAAFQRPWRPWRDTRKPKPTARARAPRRHSAVACRSEWAARERFPKLLVRSRFSALHNQSTLPIAQTALARRAPSAQGSTPPRPRAAAASEHGSGRGSGAAPVE